jgi:prolyl oligopeptidase
MAGEPVVTAGAPAGRGPKIRPDEGPTVVFTPGSNTAVMVVNEGVKNEVDLYLAPAAAAAAGTATWRKVADRSEGVTGLTARGETLYLLTNQNAPTFRVTRMPASGTAATATEVIAARSGRVLEIVGAASDALYVAALEGVYAKLLRLPHDGGALEELPLPAKGTIGQMFTDPRQPGATVMMGGWTSPLTHYRYDPAAKRFAELPIGKRPAGFDPKRYAVHDLQPTAKDGVRVPLSLVTAAGPKRARPLLLTAYGSYGISQLPNFSPARIALIEAGGTSATCHVRGGGELGRPGGWAARTTRSSTPGAT